MTLRLSNIQARRLLLHSQALFAERPGSESADGTLSVLRQLGYVQIDTLAVVARAHNHTLWNRNHKFLPSHIDQLQRDSAVFEYWAHALAYLPIENFRYSLPMMQRIAGGQRHWYKRDLKLMRRVEDRIRAEGPLSARDFTDRKTSNAMWARSPSKNALEQLFMEGKLMIPFRENFTKSYDLTERVLPDGLDLRVPSEEEQQTFLILEYLKANGIGNAQEISYLRKGIKPQIKRQLQHLMEDGKICEIETYGERYFALPEQLGNADKDLPRRIKILSPFDNSIIQRRRLATLFNFDYQIECYVKQADRKYGYFCLPLLFSNRFIGRMDCKAERKAAVLQIIHLHLEDQVTLTGALIEAIRIEFLRFARFNGCSTLAIDRISARGLSTSELKRLKTLLNSLP